MSDSELVETQRAYITQLEEEVKELKGQRRLDINDISRLEGETLSAVVNIMGASGDPITTLRRSSYIPLTMADSIAEVEEEARRYKDVDPDGYEMLLHLVEWLVSEEGQGRADFNAVMSGRASKAYKDKEMQKLLQDMQEAEGGER